MEHKFLLVGLVALLASSYFLAHDQLFKSTNNDDTIAAEFASFKSNFGKKYAGSSEDNYRLAVFTQNYERIQAHNSDSTQSYTLGVTQFADLTQEEFVDIYLMKANELPEINDLEIAELDTKNLVGSADWRSRAVSQVKNQGSCGSCWTFSTTGALEGHAAIFGGGLKNFSEQQILDCVREDYGCEGCNGGWPYQALTWVSKNGAVSQKEYPYRGVRGNCQKPTGAYKTKGIKKITSNVSSLKAALEKQPVSVCVDASNWSLYRGGIFKNCGSGINHAVTLVAYNQDGWVVKNSWATSWGEQGFIRLADGNTCGIVSNSVVPV